MRQPGPGYDPLRLLLLLLLPPPPNSLASCAGAFHIQFAVEWLAIIGSGIIHLIIVIIIIIHMDSSGRTIASTRFKWNIWIWPPTSAFVPKFCPMHSVGEIKLELYTIHHSLCRISYLCKYASKVGWNWTVFAQTGRSPPLVLCCPLCVRN